MQMQQRQPSSVRAASRPQLVTSTSIDQISPMPVDAGIQHKMNGKETRNAYPKKLRNLHWNA